MQLEFKPDWEETKEHYRAFWAHEYFSRAAVGVWAPLDNPPDEPPPEQPATPYERWTDLDYIAACNTYGMRRTFYGGEAFPTWSPAAGHPGHTSIPVLLGCPIDLDFKTGWVHPHPDAGGDSLSAILDLRIDREGDWWKFALKALERAARESAGRCIPSVGAFGGCGDTLAAIRGNDQLLLDVLDRPDEVVAAEIYLMDMWCEVYEAFYPITHENAEGSTCWFPCWSPGRFYATQNDFAYMIGPDMFRELFLPIIERQTRYLDHAVHHVDGVGNFAHVPALCELPRLQTFQILPGEGQPSPLHYMDTLKFVQAAGKNLWLDLKPEDVKPALEQLSARGLFIKTGCKSEAEARRLLKDVERWSVDRG